MGTESILGLMEGCIMGTESIIKCMEKDVFIGRMGSLMKGLMWKTRRKDMGCFLGLMGRDMKGIGKEGNSMESESW